MMGKGGSAMQLEDYFEFERFPTEHGEVERIRIKGHRIRIENIVELYSSGKTAEEIQRQSYPSLTLEEVYAAITYYLRNKEAVEAYIARGERVADAYYREYLEHGPYWLRDKALKQRELAQKPPAGNQPHE
jgi:uncharacterized protein (DUF433 family)